MSDFLSRKHAVGPYLIHKKSWTPEIGLIKGYYACRQLPEPTCREILKKKNVKKSVKISVKILHLKLQNLKKFPLLEMHRLELALKTDTSSFQK